MQLHSYRLKNFRRLKDAHIELADDISIFVGSNNSGKTSATQAIQAFVTGGRDRFSLYDFSSSCWRLFDEAGDINLAEPVPDGFSLPSIEPDLWFEVAAPDLYLVIPLLPSTAWEGTKVGIRVSLSAKNPTTLIQRNEHGQVKLLVIVHQMAAKRLGFGELYTALNSKAPNAFKDGFLDGSAWPLSPFVKFLIPVAVAHNEGRQLEVMRLIREYSPLLEKDNLLRTNVAERLKILSELIASIADAITGNSNATIGEVLKKVYGAGLLILDHRLASYLDPNAPPPVPPVEEADNDDDQEDDESDKEIASMDAFLACPATQLLPYQTYISERSPFWTQQGIKGAEFDRVLVVLDDAESTHFQFSYEKYLGLKAPSDTDRKHIEAGEETTIDRTRRLFYVSCTRALKDLAVVLFTADPGHAEGHVRQLGLFEPNSIHTQAVFDAG